MPAGRLSLGDMVLLWQGAQDPSPILPPFCEKTVRVLHESDPKAPGCPRGFALFGKSARASLTDFVRMVQRCRSAGAKNSQQDILGLYVDQRLTHRSPRVSNPPLQISKLHSQ